MGGDSGILDRYEAAHRHMMEYLTSIHNKIKFDLRTIPVEEFMDFVMITTTTLYSVMVYLAHKEDTSIDAQLEYLGIGVLKNLGERRNND